MKKKISKPALKNEFYYFIILFALFLFSFSNITIVNAQWEECNNGLSDYEVWCFITDSNNTYVGIDGGVFMTTDNGDNWIAKNKGFISWKGPEVMSLAINGSTIFAGTMCDGIFMSTDKGENWERKSNGLPCAINGLDISFSVIIYAIIINGNNIYAGTHRGVYISTDNGENWTAKNNGLPRLDTLYRGVNSMAISGENNIFAGTTWNGVFMTSDNGDNWFNKNKGIGNLAVYSLAISGNNIFAGTEYGGIFLSTDNGDNWKYIAMKNTIIAAIVIKDNYIFAGGGFYISSNNGNDWTTYLDNIGVICIIINGDYAFAGTASHGIFRAKLSDLGITDVKENKQTLAQIIYPNPASDLVKIRMKEQPSGNVQIRIIDLFGRTVYNSIEIYTEQFNEKTIDCSSFPNGFYSAVITYNNKNECLPFLISK